MGNLPEPSSKHQFKHDPRDCQKDCCRLDVCYILDNEIQFIMLDSTRNVLIDLRKGIKMGQYKHSNDLRYIAAMRCNPNRYYDLLKQQQQLKQLQIQRNEITEGKIDAKFMVLISRLDDLIQKPFDINTLIKTDEINNSMDQMVDIRIEINKMEKLIVKKKDMEDRIKLGEETESQQENEVRMKDLMVEKEREECEIIVKKILNEFSYLKENFENRRIEVEENINKLDKIKVMIEKIESSMNSEVVQGYGKNKGKEKEIEKEFQEVVSKGIELLNVNLQNGCANNGKTGNVSVNLNCKKINTKSKIVLNDLGYGIFELEAKKIEIEKQAKLQAIAEKQAKMEEELLAAKLANEQKLKEMALMAEKQRAQELEEIKKQLMNGGSNLSDLQKLTEMANKQKNEILSSLEKNAQLMAEAEQNVQQKKIDFQQESQKLHSPNLLTVTGVNNDVSDWNIMNTLYVNCGPCNNQCMYLTDECGCLDICTNCASDTDWNDCDNIHRFFIIDDGG